MRKLELISALTFLAWMTACGTSGPQETGSGGAASVDAGSSADSSTASGGAAGGGARSVPPGGSMERGGGAGAGSSSHATGMSSSQLVASWDLGWNVGNSLDVPEGETRWGNPPISAELLRAVAEAGFDVVRIPVTWSNHTGAGPDYVIERRYLERVAEVVGYAQQAGLAAIINIHHDGADAFRGPEWLTLNDGSGRVTEANNKAVEERFVKVWAQIAGHFKDHDEGLLFESMNEIHDGYEAPNPVYYDIINNLNQKFVDVVRSSGGANATRHLVVPGYNTNIGFTIAGFKKPNDTLADRLILSVHYYDPYTYTITAKTHTWGAASAGADSDGQEAHVRSEFDRLKAKFVDQGMPVIIGEYGAPHQDGFADYRRYYMEYLTKAAVERGILPIYWDNGAKGSGADKFALFDRATYAPVHPNVLDAMMRAATSAYSLKDIALPTP